MRLKSIWYDNYKRGELKLKDIKIGDKITNREYKSDKIGIVDRFVPIDTICIKWKGAESGVDIDTFNEIYTNITYEKNIIRLKKLKRIGK